MTADALLVVIDMQNDFVLPIGSLSVNGAMNIVPMINSIRDRFNKVMWTQDWHPADHISYVTNHPNHKVYDQINTGSYTQVLFPPHCLQNSEGAEIHKDLVRKEGDLYVKKGQHKDVDSYSCFFDVVKTEKTDANNQISKIGLKKLYFCGVATDYCVKSSVLDALTLGYETYVIEDAIAGCVPKDSAAAIAEMKAKGAKFVKLANL